MDGNYTEADIQNVLNIFDGFGDSDVGRLKLKIDENVDAGEYGACPAVECITDDAVRRALITLCKKAGITYYPPHQIRFYGAMEMVNETEDIYSVSHFLGHTN